VSSTPYVAGIRNLTLTKYVGIILNKFYLLVFIHLNFIMTKYSDLLPLRTKPTECVYAVDLLGCKPNFM